MGYGPGSSYRSGLNPILNGREISGMSRTEQAMLGIVPSIIPRSPALGAALEEVMKRRKDEVGNIIGEE